ncbi:DUF892 family protein [Ensifer sp. 4252]|uniref:DUF892 family protein n=1 Tax=Ensifer sp. 4252 TaxID=3373915 RepID=UPI003D219E17
MERFSRERKIYFFEEFILTDHHFPYLEFHSFAGTAVKAVRPRIPDRWSEAQRQAGLVGLVDELLELLGPKPPILWFYTPMMFPLARHVDAAAVVYDCMDELANFRFASPMLADLERELLHRADVVFTGGHSLYEAKRLLHDNIYPFPSSVDVCHFQSARKLCVTPPEQAQIPRPILGFCGVIDERLDLELTAALARQRPEWSIVFIGPEAKIRTEDLPRAPNIHYLGQKDYLSLPAYFSGWDVALMPFARNDATRFISPTKTPEYLAAGLPVVSTPITDVVRQYGDMRGVYFASDAPSLVCACEEALQLEPKRGEWLNAVDERLATLSWDDTHRRMSRLVEDVVEPAVRVPLPPVARKTPRSSWRRRRFDYVIVGAGFAGAVLAERLANESGQRVLVCDRRPHIGGNAYDFYNESGILVHKYGPHIFHTNSEAIFDYLSRFTAWRPYEAANNAELKKAAEEHLSETKDQIKKLEQVFKSIGKTASGEKCDAIEGLIKEADGVMKEAEGTALDAGLLAACQAVEHYEIVRYGALREWAKDLGHDEAHKLLSEILDQEKATNNKLTNLAVTSINKTSTRSRAA